MKQLSVPRILPTELVGKHVAVKWGNASQGGWYIAQVKAILLGTRTLERIKYSFGTFNPTHEVQFLSDNKTAQVPLTWATMCEDEHRNVQKGVWVLLENRPLSDARAAEHAAHGSLRAPQTSQVRRGRPRTNRFAPAHGPTSSPSKTVSAGDIFSFNHSHLQKACKKSLRHICSVWHRKLEQQKVYKKMPCIAITSDSSPPSDSD